MTTSFLTGITMFSQNPQQLATFYRDILGIPFEMAQHGKLGEHLECEINNIHFAILKKGQIADGGNIIVSFAVPNLRSLLDELSQRNIKPLHPIIDIGEGKFVSTISDPDGNAIRLIELDPAIYGQ